MKDFMRRNLKAGVLIVMIASLFTIRVIAFASNFGAIEHDSGWLLGVAKNLAMRGIYASYTNLVDQDGVGVFPSIHGRTSAQDKDGYIYFPELISVGPGYLFPQAAFLKLFGYGYWQYRFVPVLSFFLLLLFILSITYFLGGITSIVLLSLWIYVLPQLTLQFAYESFGEHIALLYILISFCLICLAINKNYSKYLSLISGLFFSFSILTKTIFVLNAVPVICLGLFELFSTKKIKNIILMFLYFFIGFLLPYFTFEIYRYLTLRNIFGVEGYNSVNNSLKWVLVNNGSGLDWNSSLDLQFIRQKFSILRELGIKQLSFGWLFLLLTVAISKKSLQSRNTLYRILWIAMVCTFSWYILFSPTGWGRHVWHGLVIGMIVSSAFISQILTRLRVNGMTKLFITFLFITLMFSASKMNINFILSQRDIDYINENRYLYGIQGFSSVPYFSYADQLGVVQYFQSHIYPNDTVYYLGWFLVAELSPLVDKVFYPFSRYTNISYGKNKDGNNYIIIGPYQKGKIKITADEYIEEKTQALCSDIVYENDSYLLCRIKSKLTQEEIDVGLVSDY